MRYVMCAICAFSVLYADAASAAKVQYTGVQLVQDKTVSPCTFGLRSQRRNAPKLLPCWIWQQLQQRTSE